MDELKVKTDKLKEGVGGLALAVLALFLMACVNGWGVSVLWNWFIQPLGAPGISIAQAFGVVLLTRLTGYQPNPEHVQGRLLDRLVARAVLVALVVGVAWVAKGFA